MKNRLKLLLTQFSLRMSLLCVFIATAVVMAHGAESLRVEAQLSEGKLYQGQTVCLTLKFYSSSPDIEFVELQNAFDVRGLSLLRVRRTNDNDGIMERKGKDKDAFQAVVYKAMLLVNNVDEIEIPSIYFSVGIPEYTTFNHPFYGAIRQKYINKRTISTKPLTRKVKRLPSSPEEFTGAIGNFTIEGIVPPGEIYSGGTALVQYRITGNGLLKENNMPKLGLTIPDDIALKSHTASAASIADGDKLRSELDVDYILSVPHEGTFKLQPMKFTFFDPSSGRYKTVSSESLTITVEESEIPSEPVILHNI